MANQEGEGEREECEREGEKEAAAAGAAKRPERSVPSGVETRARSLSSGLPLGTGTAPRWTKKKILFPVWLLGRPRMEWARRVRGSRAPWINSCSSRASRVAEREKRSSSWSPSLSLTHFLSFSPPHQRRGNKKFRFPVWNATRERGRARKSKGALVVTTGGFEVFTFLFSMSEEEKTPLARNAYPFRFF